MCMGMLPHIYHFINQQSLGHLVGDRLIRV